MTSETVKAIKDVVRRINEAWLGGATEQLRELLHENIVVVHPGFAQREMGRERCIAGYEEFASRAVVHEFDEQDMVVDVWGNTAVVSYRFEIDYEMGEARYQDTGHDLFVLTRHDGAWRAVWRTLIPTTAAT